MATTCWRIAGISLVIVGLTVVLQGCGSEDEKAPENNGGTDDNSGNSGATPAPTAEATTTTWTCGQKAAVMASSHTWNVPVPETKTKGVAVESSTFILPPFRGNFHLYYFPVGDANAQTGYCSAYLWSSVTMNAHLRLSLIDDLQISYTKDMANLQIESGATHGFKDMTNTIAGAVSIKVELDEVIDPTTIMDSDVITRRVLDVNKTVVVEAVYTCWRYLQSDKPDTSWLKVVTRYKGNTSCTDETKVEKVMEVGLASGKLDGLHAMCEGNYTIITQTKLAECTLANLKSNCATAATENVV